MSRPISLQRRMTSLVAAPASLAAAALIVLALTHRSARPTLAIAFGIAAILVPLGSMLAMRHTSARLRSVIAGLAERGEAIIDGESTATRASPMVTELAPITEVLDAVAEQQRIVRAQTDALAAGSYDDPIFQARVKGSVGTVVRGSVDILRSAGEQLRDREAVNASLMESVSDAIVVVDRHGRVLESNAVAKVALDLFDGSLERALPTWWELDNGEHDFSRSLADGTLTLTQLSKSQLVTSDGPVTMLCWRDISGERAVQAQIAKVARTDIVTGLPNRHGLLVAYDRLVELGRGTSVVHVALDSFGRLNQRHGFRSGDVTMRTISERLRNIVRDGDTVARVSGDEFVFLLDSSAQEVPHLAQRIVETISEPVELANGVRVAVTAHAGWSSGAADASQELLRQANYALGEAEAVESRIARYDENVARRDANVRDWEEQLRRAVAHDEFVLFAQPIVDTRETRVAGLEVFLRWEHPSGRLISPAEFIAIAEESELIADIDRWVIRRCVAEAASADPGLVFSLNVSSRFLASKAMPTFVRSILDEYGLPAGRIQVDVTETNVAGDAAGAIESIRRLHAMGVKVALDDFGTGYSSLAQLVKLAVSTIKIDGHIVRSIVEPEGRGVVAALLAFAGKRDLAVVAEGVESQDEVDRLVELGCHLQQGYFHRRPSRLDELLASLERSEPSDALV